jgi:hypothetical protein
MSRITFGVPNHNMVKQFDREDVGRFPELAGYGYICRRRTWIATYAVSGISGVMPRPVLCRMPRFFASESLHLDAA